MKELMKKTVSMMKSTSCKTVEDSPKKIKNYSIVDPRSTSPIGFFTKSKISQSFYLNSSEILNEEENIEK